MPERPRFKRFFHPEVVPGEGVFLLSETGSSVLRGAVFVHMAPLLDGTHTEMEIAEALQETVPPAQVFFALETLKRDGYITHAHPEMSDEQAAFWELLQVDPVAAERRLRDEPLSLQAVGSSVDLSPLRVALESSGLRLRSIEDAVTDVVVVEDYLCVELDAINRAALARGRPWVLARLKGAEVWLGPMFTPHSGCWQCLRHRLEGHRKVEHYLQGRKKDPSPFPSARATLPSITQTAAQLLSTELAKWVVTGHTPLIGTTITFNALTLETTRHFLTRRPQCAACGDPEVFSRQGARPVLLAPRTGRVADGGSRSQDAAQTFARLEPQLSPITGIVSGMRQTSRADDDGGLLFSYMTDHNFVHMSESLYFLKANLRSHSGGKGKTDLQARCSALCESIERYSSVYQGDEARVTARLDALDVPALLPNELMLYSDAQLASRDQWNSNGVMYCWVPEPFDARWEIDWSPAWSLTKGRRVFLPTGFCYYGYPWRGRPQYSRADSNGCAAGSCLEEAILQGFMELVERDAVAIWWYNQLRRPEVDLGSFGEPFFEALVAHFAARARTLRVIDITSDLQIPTFVAVSHRTDRPTQEIIFGFGTHFDATTAVARALTEHNQFIPHVVVGDLSQPPTNVMTRWYREAKVEVETFVAPDETQPARRRQDYPVHASSDLREDVMRCVEIVEALGMETLVMDHTRPDTGLSVARVVVPGLRHFWTRFAPGRLYDVPVKMGWRASPSSENALNPYPMFL